MDLTYSGYQFHDVSNENIDPALLANDGNSQTFENDVEMATVDHSIEQQNDHAMAYPNTPQTPSRGLNPEATAYQPLSQQGGSLSTSSFENVANEGGRPQPRMLQWHPALALGRGRPYQTQTPPHNNLPWQGSNRFAPLSPEWTGGHVGQQQPSMAPWTPQPYHLQANAYLTPPNTGGFYRFTGGEDPFLSPNFASIPQPPAFNPPLGAAVTNNSTHLSATNVSTLPTDTPQSQHMDEWNAQSYNLGDRTQRTRRRSLAPPPTPTHSNRGRQRDSRTSSVSGLTCDTCGSNNFKKQHELDHHRRWHGEKTQVCSICNKGFVAHKDLVRHMATHNKAERHIFCNIIGCKYHEKGFGRLDHLKRHYDKKHPGETPPTPTTSSFGGG